MPWQTPKTDWVKTDYFNIEDYNRIIGNMEVIHELSAEVNPEFEIDHLLEKTYSDYLYADEFNVLESNFSAISKGTYPYVPAEAKSYYANQPTPNYEEFNRLESLLLQRYDYLVNQANGRKTLSFVLGGGEF